MRGDKIIVGVPEYKRILSGENCEICKRELEIGQKRICFSCETKIYGG